MEISLNLLKLEGYEDGKPRYVGMYDTSIEDELKGVLNFFIVTR